MYVCMYVCMYAYFSECIYNINVCVRMYIIHYVRLSYILYIPIADALLTVIVMMLS